MLSLIIISMVLLMYASLWAIYTKAGQEGWTVFIPIYNIIVLGSIIRKPWWWVLLLHIPLVNFFIYILTCIELAKVFGKDHLYAIGLVVVPFVFLPLLAFSSARYIHIEESGLMDHLIDYQ